MQNIMYLTVNQGVLGSTPIAIGARRGAKMKPMKIGFFYGIKSAFLCWEPKSALAEK